MLIVYFYLIGFGNIAVWSWPASRRLINSQSHAPEFYADQARLFSTGDWRPVIFTKEGIANDLVSRSILTLSNVLT